MKILLPNKVELNYKVKGEGLPLLLLHGNGDSHKELETLGDALTNHYKVYFIDSRGHGDSSHHDTFFNYNDLAEDIDLFIQTLALENVNIIGHSDGAIIATLLAMENKSYLRKIILLGVTLKPEQMKSKWRNWIQTEYEKNKHPLFKLMMYEPQIEFKDLEKINIPTYIVAAEDDVMEKEYYVEISNRITKGKLYVVENENHTSYVNQTDKFAKKALEFLNT